MKPTIACLLYDVAKALGYSHRIADEITGNHWVNQPIFSRKRGASRAPHARRRV